MYNLLLLMLLSAHIGFKYNEMRKITDLRFCAVNFVRDLVEWV